MNSESLAEDGRFKHVRTSLTLSGLLHESAMRNMERRGFTRNLSQYIAQLIREDSLSGQNGQVNHKTKNKTKNKKGR